MLGEKASAFEPLGFLAACRQSVIARRHAVARARESEDLPGVMSLPDCEGGKVGTVAGAAGLSSK